MNKETETISLTITAEQLSLIQGALLATGGTDQRALSEVLTAQAKGRILSFTEARREVIRPEILTAVKTLGFLPIPNTPQSISPKTEGIPDPVTGNIPEVVWFKYDAMFFPESCVLLNLKTWEAYELEDVAEVVQTLREWNWYGFELLKGNPIESDVIKTPTATECKAVKFKPNKT